MKGWRLFFGTALILMVCVGWLLFVHATATTRDVRDDDDPPRSLEPTTIMNSSPELLALGKKVYNRRCAPCHGVDGRGEGEAAYLLYPKPRDFVRADYRVVSTWEGVPTDLDLYGVISRGMPGSAMPSWPNLPEKTRWGLVHYIKSFAKKPIAAHTDVTDEPPGVIKVPAEPPFDEAAKDRAAMLFARACAPCHGETGKGDGVQEQFDGKGLPTRPRDFTQGVFKGSSEPEAVYRRLVAGMRGTPMPRNRWAHGDDAWHLTHLILSMSSEVRRDIVEMRRFRIVARRVARIPDHPDSGVWREAQPVHLHLMPLWWRDDRPEALTVKALHDGNEIALLLAWSDTSHDHTAIRTQDFRDAAAIEFSFEKDPPFFGMGEERHPVDIWMWKSERQADLEPAFQDLEKIYPNLGIDSYPNLMKSELEQPLRHALTLESDPTFVTGWGAGNIVSDPSRESSAEDLLAEGFGTLRARPRVNQTVQAKGVFDIGTYRVVFRRGLREEGAKRGSLQLRPGTTVPVSFAVWDGGAGDRDGKKSVTIWQELVIKE